MQSVVFDMDGVLVDTEHVWDEVRERLVGDWEGRYPPGAQEAMMGMSSIEWSSYMHDELGLRQSPDEINAEVVRRMLERYATDLPVVPGARDAVRQLAAAGHALAVASSSNRELIDAVLLAMTLHEAFSATVSSEEVARGKPSPDVYLEAARRLGVDPRTCVAIEDSANGISSAHAAGMVVVAYPNAQFPPPADVLALAARELGSLAELPRVVASLGATQDAQSA